MPTARSPDTLYFDGACGLCRRTTRILRALDWFRRLRFVDMTAVPEEGLPVSFETALQGIPMRTGDGRVLIGFPAARRAMLQTPLGVIPALVLYLPGFSWGGRRVYKYVATHRSRSLACST